MSFVAGEDSPPHRKRCRRFGIWPPLSILPPTDLPPSSPGPGPLSPSLCPTALLAPHPLPFLLRSKTRGMGAGRKLRVHRREQHWADKKYKKAHQGNEWKKPFAGCSHAKGIVLEKM